MRYKQFICIHLEKWWRRAKNQVKWDEKCGISTTGGKRRFEEEKGKLGDIRENVGGFWKSMGDFRGISSWNKRGKEDNGLNECEGCESKKCKIAVGRTHVRARREFSTVRRVNSSSPTLPYHELGKMDGNRQTRLEQESTKRDRVREGRCVLQHVTTQFCKIDFSNRKISKKKCHYSVDFSHFRLISSHILIEGRGKERRTDE